MTAGPLRPSRTVLIAALLFAVYFALAALLQLASGAFHCEFSAYPDEPAHYVTSLMLREYITGPSPLNPLRFAEEYYRHYPKVAFGHWPPVFYIVQSCWMLLFSASRASVRLEIAATTALSALSIWLVCRRAFNNVAAIVAGALLVCIPLVQSSTDEEMAETLLLLLCFWSAVYFAYYLGSETTWDSLWFAVFFSLAVLTKGSGWLLALVPPVCMLLLRRLNMLTRRSFWLGVLVVAVCCLPWQIVTLRSAERGWTGGSKPSVGYTLSSLWDFLGILVHITGPILSLVILLGLIVSVVLPAVRRTLRPMPAAMFALLFGDWFFHSLVPAGVEDRKMVLAVPALIYFLVAGALWIADWLPIPSFTLTAKRIAVGLICGAVFLWETFAIPPSYPYGYTQVARYITSAPAWDRAMILVSSESGGEGLLISEMAMCQPRPKDTIVRSTKELAHVDWQGDHYQSLFSTPDDLIAYLKRRHIDLVVLDNFAAQTPFEHHRLLEQAAQSHPEMFRLMHSFPGESSLAQGRISVYRFAPSGSGY